MRIFPFLSVVALSLLAAACGGKAAPQLGGNSANTRPSAPAAAPVASAPRSKLTLSLPALAKLQPGAQFAVALRADTTEALFQASARLQYDPNQVQPVLAERGAQVPADAVFLARPDATTLTTTAADGTRMGIVPFSFTLPPGRPGLAAGKTELLRVRFRVLRALRGDAGLRLLNDPLFLQLRRPDGGRIPFDLASEAGGR